MKQGTPVVEGVEWKERQGYVFPRFVWWGVVSAADCASVAVSTIMVSQAAGDARGNHNPPQTKARHTIHFENSIPYAQQSMTEQRAFL